MKKALLTTSTALAAVALLAGCGGTPAAPDPSAPEPSASDEPAPTGQAPDGEAVALELWSWDPNLDKIVDLWNSQNPDVQVSITDNATGGDDLVAKILTAHSSGDAADIVKVEYQQLPSLIAGGAAADISSYVPDAAANFTEGAFAQVSFDGQVYGLPQDFAPLVFFYREDILAEHDIAVPTTWDEYAQAARDLRSADPNVWLGTFSASDSGWFTGLVQQAGANWWSFADDQWTVAVNDEASKKVADFWQGLIDEGAIKSDPFWTPQWNTEMNDGTLAGWISGAWAPAQLPTIAPDGIGKWKMAALPAWTAGDTTTGIWGGSAYVVTVDSDYPEQAAAFVDWLNTSDEALAMQINTINVFPSALSGQSLPDLAEPPLFMENQADYYALVAEIAQSARSFDIWGPNATVMAAAYSDSFKNAIQDKTSFSDALDTVQKAVADDMKSKGFSLAE